MTNDRFIKYIEDCVSLIEIEEHAKKLMAVAEAANAVYSSAAQTTPDSIWEVDDEEMQWLGRALKELQGE